MADSGKESKDNKRKRGAAAKKEKDREKDRPAPAPPMQDIKLPDKYRLLPVPKADAANAQPDDVVQLSRTAKAAQITLQDDMLTASGCKGYRMVRATHGVASGSWYFEVKVNTPHNGEDGHTRLGWCTEMGELQAPVGYDQNSYAYRDRVANAAIDTPGSRFHENLNPNPNPNPNSQPGLQEFNTMAKDCPWQTKDFDLTKSKETVAQQFAVVNSIDTMKVRVRVRLRVRVRVTVTVSSSPWSTPSTR
jgi:hypothetical protein